MSDFEIPTPPDQPRYHEHAAGSPGDDRPLSERFADRMLVEHGLTISPELRAAITQAFEAGRACEAEPDESCPHCGAEPDYDDGCASREAYKAEMLRQVRAGVADDMFSSEAPSVSVGDILRHLDELDDIPF